MVYGGFYGEKTAGAQYGAMKGHTLNDLWMLGIATLQSRLSA